MNVRQTSLEVYRRIEAEGLLSKVRFKTYDILFKHGPLTANEIARYAKSIYGEKPARHNYNSRLGELIETGCTVELGATTCKVTGNSAYLYDVTNKVPKKLERKIAPTTKELINALCEQLESFDDPDDNWQIRTDALLRQCEKYRTRKR